MSTNIKYTKKIDKIITDLYTQIYNIYYSEDIFYSENNIQDAITKIEKISNYRILNENSTNTEYILEKKRFFEYQCDNILTNLKDILKEIQKPKIQQSKIQKLNRENFVNNWKKRNYNNNKIDAIIYDLKKRHKCYNKKFNIFINNKILQDHYYNVLTGSSIPKIDVFDYFKNDSDYQNINSDLSGILHFYPHKDVDKNEEKSLKTIFKGYIDKIKFFLETPLVREKDNKTYIYENKTNGKVTKFSYDRYKKNYPNLSEFEYHEGKKRFTTLSLETKKVGTYSDEYGVEDILKKRKKTIQDELLKYTNDYNENEKEINNIIKNIKLEDLKDKHIELLNKKWFYDLFRRLDLGSDCNDIIWGNYDFFNDKKNTFPWIKKKHFPLSKKNNESEENFNERKNNIDKKIKDIRKFLDPRWTKDGNTFGSNTSDNNLNKWTFENKNGDRRPYLFGKVKDISDILSYNNYMKGILMMGGIYDISEYIFWSINLNKLFNYCSIGNNKNILFPVVLYIKTKFPKRYNIYDKKFLTNETKHKYLGFTRLSLYQDKKRNYKNTASRQYYDNIIYKNIYLYKEINTNNKIILDDYSRKVSDNSYLASPSVTYLEFRNFLHNFKNKDFKIKAFRSKEHKEFIFLCKDENVRHIPPDLLIELEEIKLEKRKDTFHEMNNYYQFNDDPLISGEEIDIIIKKEWKHWAIKNKEKEIKDKFEIYFNNTNNNTIKIGGKYKRKKKAKQ